MRVPVKMEGGTVIKKAVKLEEISKKDAIRLGKSG